MRVLVASTLTGQRIVATRDLFAADYRCPMCETAVILKRGRKVAAHFAHLPGAECPFAEGESWRHLEAKRVLAEEFTALGWDCRIEVPHRALGRRVDVGVKVPDGQGGVMYVAVEVQDSVIQVESMKQRVMADRRIGYASTAWLFTSHRAGSLLLAAQVDEEVRVPDDMLWVVNRYGQGVPIIDPVARTIHVAHLSRVMRFGETREWYTEHGDLTGFTSSDRVLRKTRRVDSLTQRGFRLTLVPGKFGDHWAVAFQS